MPDDRPDKHAARARIAKRRETPIELAERIGDAYGLVLVLILATFVVVMTLPPEGKGGRIVTVAIASVTAIVALTSSSVRPARVRLAVVTGLIAVVAATLAELVPAENLLGVAFVIVSVQLTIAAVVILRRVVTARVVDFRTILGAISVFTLLGLLFAFLYLAFGRWSGTPFFTGTPHPSASAYVFFSYTTLTTTGYGNLVPAGTVGQSFAVLEMLLGQIFLVTLVAGLVSLWRPGRTGGDQDGAESAKA